jgi:hypothetical protein
MTLTSGTKLGPYESSPPSARRWTKKPNHGTCNLDHLDLNPLLLVPMCSGGGYILKIKREIDALGCTHRERGAMPPPFGGDLTKDTHSFSVFFPH